MLPAASPSVFAALWFATPWSTNEDGYREIISSVDAVPTVPTSGDGVVLVSVPIRRLVKLAGSSGATVFVTR